MKRSLACPPPTGVSGTLGAAESVTGAMTGAATGVGTETGEIGGVSRETLEIVYKHSLKKDGRGCFHLEIHRYSFEIMHKIFINNPFHFWLRNS